MTNPLQQKFIVELALLKALAVREHYDNYIGYVHQDKLIEYTKVFLEAYQNYYDLYPEHKEIAFDTFHTQFMTNWHARDMHDEIKDVYTKAIQKVKEEPAGDAEKALLGLINAQLMENIHKIVDKPFTSEQLRQEIDGYELKRIAILKEHDPDVCGLYDIDFASIDKSEGIPFCHEPLQECLGGLVKGSFVLYNAPFGIGKTAELVEQAVHTIKWRLKAKEFRPILWVNTEGPTSVVWGRIWSNLYKEAVPLGYKDIMKQKEKITKHFEKTFGTNALWVIKGRGKGLNYLRSKILQFEPCLVILDMAAQIMGSGAGKNTSDTRNLEIYFDTLREFSAEYCPILATVQAGNSAKWWDKEAHKYRYKKWPDADDIYSSKSAIQGAAETIISIGRDDQHEYTRYLHTTKLKDELPPVKFMCELNKKYSSYESCTKITGGYDE